jgi:hypothetical protein
MSWRPLYQRALEEHDASKLAELTAQTEWAMVRRMEDIGSSDDQNGIRFGTPVTGCL